MSADANTEKVIRELYQEAETKLEDATGSLTSRGGRFEAVGRGQASRLQATTYLEFCRGVSFGIREAAARLGIRGITINPPEPPDDPVPLPPKP